MADIRGTGVDDRLVGTRLDDTLTGLTGADVLIGARGRDVLDGGFGIDTASYETSVKRVTADLSDSGENRGDAKGDEYISIERLIGSDNDDELRGGEGDTVLFGGRGDDTLVGQFGTTRLIGGIGADTLIGFGVNNLAAYWLASRGVRADLDNAARNSGEAAGDTFENINGIEGSEFADRLYGDGRDNTLAGLDGDDRLFGRSGNDRISGGLGADLVHGGRGVDTAVYGNADAAVRVDLANADRNSREAEGDRFVNIEGVDGSQFDDNLAGDDNDNRISGGGGDDRINGRGGDDQLTGNIGDDRITGGSGSDTMFGSLGADALNGGGGFDIAAYWSASSGITVDLKRPSDNTGEARGDGFRSVEGVAGSSFSDILRGDDEVNRLFGRDGDDTLEGRDGDDSLFGDAGDDDLVGGADDDTMVGGLGGDRLYGGAGVDTASYALATAGVTADLVDEGQNTGEAGGDRYRSVENLIGSNSDDTLRGTGQDNRLTGRAGDDELGGGGGNDRLIGEQGADTLIGGIGEDDLNGGAGRDFLTGGGDADTFRFTEAPTNADVDEITDFEIGVDVIALARFIFGGLPAGALDESNFVAGESATDADHRIIYQESIGRLSFDADGAGGQDDVRFALVTAGLELTASDFILI